LVSAFGLVYHELDAISVAGQFLFEFEAFLVQIEFFGHTHVVDAIIPLE
jgi:hypothetical protein